jgi:aflatoxin B1 aldehyde reductase
MYSAITRQVEEELIPCLRYHDIAFYAYSPLGGGIMSGKYKFEQQEDKSIVKGRFNGVGWDKVYRERYWKQEHFTAMEELKVLLEEHHPGEGVTVPAAAFRWIFHHSALDGGRGDCVVLGASRPDQVRMNLELSEQDPLAEPVVGFFNDWWKSTKHLCPTYFR